MRVIFHVTHTRCTPNLHLPLLDFQYTIRQVCAYSQVEGARPVGCAGGVMAEPAYRVSVPDLTFYQQSVPCQFNCPVRTDARGYVTAIAQGDYERAYLIARETNPFASTCGYVCGAPCEAACRRGKIDQPIAIRALKRFVDDRYGVYMGESGQTQQPPAWPTYTGTTAGFDMGNTTFPTSRRRTATTRLNAAGWRPLRDRFTQNPKNSGRNYPPPASNRAASSRSGPNCGG